MPAPRGLIQELDQYLHRRRLLEPAARILIACSGGADSVALVRLLHAVNQSDFWHWKLMVGHVNHHLRGQESRRDEDFVRRLARSLDLPFHHQDLNIQPAHQLKIVSENSARDARYKALLALARQNQCPVIALAHHADDQAETILMRMLRGAGVTGLAGMNDDDRRGKIRIVRPLLPWPRSKLRTWLMSLGTSWREDRSNLDQRFFRNRIRHELLPILETYQPRIRELLQRNSRHDRATADFLNEHARQLLRTARYRHYRSGASLARNVIASAAPAPAALALRIAISSVSGDMDGINTANLLEVLDTLRTTTARTTIQFAGRVTLILNPDRIRVIQTIHKDAQRPDHTAEKVGDYGVNSAEV
ncbi:MAG: tRNA lysidine(34) synthetase TilS [Planctomycetes bacterium]|nr:tRNA lysidine(34) synthetase TilS [Planctomycetota bacterium]